MSNHANPKCEPCGGTGYTRSRDGDDYVCAFCVGWLVQQLNEARTHARDHHLESCMSCMATESGLIHAEETLNELGEAVVSAEQNRYHWTRKSAPRDWSRLLDVLDEVSKS